MKYKIQKILDLFKYDKQFKFWKIKTNVYNIIQYFYGKYNMIQNKETIVHNIETADGSKLYCSGYNVTPYSSYEERSASKSSMRQYIDVLVAFEVLIKTEEKNVYKISTNNDIKTIISEFFNKLVFFKHEQGKKIFYSGLVSYLNELFKTNDYLNVSTRNGYEEMMFDVIHNYSSSCGFIDLQHEYFKLGDNPDDIYDNILSIITSK